MTDDSLRRASQATLAKWRRLASWVMVGLFVGLVSTLLVVRWWNNREALTPLSLDDWRRARSRWELAGIRDYRIAVRVSGRQAATYLVEVIGGEVRQALRDGAPLPQKRTWSTWTVEGMFETMARDFESVERHRLGRADASTPRLDLRGEFDPDLGLPRRYLRVEMLQRAANPEVSWEVIDFERRS